MSALNFIMSLKTNIDFFFFFHLQKLRKGNSNPRSIHRENRIVPINNNKKKKKKNNNHKDLNIHTEVSQIQ